MWLRFQIGSNSPLAKRNARMFCAASLPRKWSIRKICSSSKTSCSCGVERRRRCARSVPNGFSMMIRLRSTSPASRELVHDGERGLRRHREVVQPPMRRGPRIASDSSTAARSPCGPALPGTQWIRSANSRQVLVGDVVAAVLADRGDQTSSRNASRSARRATSPTTRRPSSSWDSCRWSMPGRSLRLARSPVAPKRTTVVAGMGPAWRRSGASGRCGAGDVRSSPGSPRRARPQGPAAASARGGPRCGAGAAPAASPAASPADCRHLEADGLQGLAELLRVRGEVEGQRDSLGTDGAEGVETSPSSPDGPALTGAMVPQGSTTLRRSRPRRDRASGPTGG